jgi:hypothetical protein
MIELLEYEQSSWVSPLLSYAPPYADANPCAPNAKANNLTVILDTSQPSLCSKSKVKNLPKRLSCRIVQPTFLSARLVPLLGLLLRLISHKFVEPEVLLIVLVGMEIDAVGLRLDDIQHPQRDV